MALRLFLLGATAALQRDADTALDAECVTDQDSAKDYPLFDCLSDQYYICCEADTGGLDPSERQRYLELGLNFKPSGVVLALEQCSESLKGVGGFSKMMDAYAGASPFAKRENLDGLYRFSACKGGSYAAWKEVQAKLAERIQANDKRVQQYKYDETLGSASQDLEAIRAEISRLEDLRVHAEYAKLLHKVDEGGVVGAGGTKPRPWQRALASAKAALAGSVSFVTSHHGWTTAGLKAELERLKALEAPACPAPPAAAKARSSSTEAEELAAKLDAAEGETTGAAPKAAAQCRKTTSCCLERAACDSDANCLKPGRNCGKSSQKSGKCCKHWWREQREKHW